MLGTIVVYTWAIWRKSQKLTKQSPFVRTSRKLRLPARKRSSVGDKNSSCSRNFQSFMKPEYSLPWSQKPSFGSIFSQFDPILNFTPSVLLCEISFVLSAIRFDRPRHSVISLILKHAAYPANIANLITQIITDEQYKLCSHSNITSKQNSHLLKQISAAVSTYS